MSKKGWLETSDGIRLEMELGVDPGDGKELLGVSVICHPHPMYGGDMRNPVVKAMATASWDEGYVPLLFNFRGTGGSGGTYSFGDKEVEDVDAAMAFARTLCPEDRVLLMGYSFGAKMATLWLNGRGKARAFIAVAVPSNTDYPDHQGIPSLYVSGELDEVAPLDDGLTRAMMVDGDHVIVEGADHFFIRGLSEIEEAVKGFIAITCPLGDEQAAPGKPF